MKSNLKVVSIFVLVLFLGGCMRDMQDQPRYEPLEKSDFYKDRRSSRTIVEGTIPRGGLKEDELFFTGKVNGEFAEIFPFEVTREVLARGRERYEINCAVCHGLAGYGDGMVVQRGFSRPSSYHVARLREAPSGYFFNVITNGFGKMAVFADQVRTKDRWAIVAYIRALQLSQNAQVSDVPPEGLEELR